MALQAMFLAIGMTSTARVEPALVTVTKLGPYLERLITHLTLISTRTCWIFQTDTNNPALQVLPQHFMTLLVFHITPTIIMDIMLTTSNLFILPILSPLLIYITIMLHPSKELEHFLITSQLALYLTITTLGPSLVTTQQDMFQFKQPLNTKDQAMLPCQDVLELHGLGNNHRQETPHHPHSHSEILFMTELDLEHLQMEAAL